jgi:hypothetical protein
MSQTNEQSIFVNNQTSADLSCAGAVALYTLLWAELRKYRKWPFSVLNRRKTLEPINTEIGLNAESNNFKTAQPILVILSSNNASPLKEFNYEGQAAKLCFSQELIQ